MILKKSQADLLENPRFKKFIDDFKKLSKKSESLSLDESRKLSNQFFLASNVVYEPIHRIQNIQISGKDQNKIDMRIFIPKASKKMPILLHFHQGGWVFGNIEASEPFCRKLANHWQCVVASVEYRLAPENPFPKPLEDCYAATKWMFENADKFGGDRKKLSVCGESAGGNLAAAVALMARDKREIALSGQILLYPVITSKMQDAPYDTCADQYFLTKDTMQFFWKMYLRPQQYSTKYLQKS